jgi:hypothetical protein
MIFKQTSIRFAMNQCNFLVLTFFYYTYPK